MSRDPTDIRYEQAASEAKDRQKKLSREQDAADFKVLLSTPAGRRFMWRMLEECGVYRSTFRPNSEAAFLEGKRAVGLFLLAQVHDLCPERLVEMLLEAKERAKQ